MEDLGNQTENQNRDAQATKKPVPNNPVLPGGTIGVLGSGQLGRMLALIARQMGYRIHVFSPGSDTPTGQVADREITAEYDDLEAVRQFAQQVDVITYEFENVPMRTALAAVEYTPVHPNPNTLSVAQNRIREKSFLYRLGLPVAPFAPVRNETELENAIRQIGTPSVLKTAESGYDGRGQVRIDSPDQAIAAWDKIKRQPAVLEKFLQFEKELSVVGARDAHGNFAHFGVFENDHSNHILDVTISPAEINPEVAQNAIQFTKQLLDELDVVGVLCVEYFLAPDGQTLIANEFAPRPHNSGHLTIESFPASQFEQQLRAICGLPLGDTTQIKPAAMANLLGDLWPSSGSPEWAAAVGFPNLSLHLYGKEDARKGRKMGHLTVLADTAADAREIAIRARTAVQSNE